MGHPVLSQNYIIVTIHFLTIAVELEDIQLQNLVPEQVESGPPQQAQQPPSNNQSQPQTPQINKYLNNNAAKEDLASSASLGNISLAFSRIPGHGKFQNIKKTQKFERF